MGYITTEYKEYAEGYGVDGLGREVWLKGCSLIGEKGVWVCEKSITPPGQWL